MQSRTRTLLTLLPRSTVASRPFTTASSLFAPRSSDPAGPPSTKDTTERLLSIMEEVSAETPEAGPDQSSILQHLRRNQVISPQHLSPHHLLTPYLPRPNFSLGHPLGPPTSFGPTHDPFIRYGLDPLKQGLMNPFWKAEFCTTMGKIKPRGKTGLQRKSQRRVGKSIRRARSMGLIPNFGISVPGQGGERY
ncbi:hypothetical protein JCM16303_004002 [Sporobolomyces ruberrimus]